MMDFMDTGNRLQIAGKILLSYKVGDDIGLWTNVHGLKDGTVLDTLKDAPPHIRIIRIHGLDLNSDGRFRIVEDHGKGPRKPDGFAKY